MADDQLQRWQSLEEAGDDEAQQVQGGLRVPAPAGDREKVAEVAGQAAEVGLHDGVGRRRGMEIDRYVEGDGGFEDGRETRIVEEEAAGGAVEHGPLEAELRDGAGELLRCPIGLF